MVTKAKAKKMRKWEAAYLAGLIDGEGCIGIYARKPNGTRRFLYHQLQVIVGMGEPEAIDFMAQVTAGYHSLRYNRDIKGHTVHEIRLYGQKGASFLKEILPFLRNKRPQAEIAIEFYQNCNFSKANQAVSEDELALRCSYEMALKAMKHGEDSIAA